MTSDPIAPWPVVRRGDAGHPLSSLQYLLCARGHRVVVDGVFGVATEGAVCEFQRSRRLARDGIVGPSTWSPLVVQLRRGSQGDAVRALQSEFQFRNLSGDPNLGVQIDGDFGDQTDAAVRGFQSALGLDASGIVDHDTWRALVSGMLSF